MNYNCSPSKVAKYQGLIAPYCAGGTGCKACRDKYDTVQRRLVQQDMEDKLRDQIMNGGDC